jgi:hypothetical protein
MANHETLEEKLFSWCDHGAGADDGSAKRQGATHRNFERFVLMWHGTNATYEEKVAQECFASHFLAVLSVVSIRLF